jgi:hypothetical protein
MYVEVPIGDGQAFLVASDDDTGVVRARRGGKEAVEAAAESFEESLSKVGHIAELVVQQFALLNGGPDHVRAEFGISLGAEAGMVVAKGKAEAHFVLELEWNRSAPKN